MSTQPVATHYDYNLDKQIIKATRADGQTIGYDYETSGRLSNVVTPNGAISFGYKNGSSQVFSITAPDGVGLTYGYDGSLQTSSSLSGPVVGQVTTGYDNFFRPNRVGVNGTDIVYGYDDDGLLTAAGRLIVSRDAANGLVTGTALDQITTSVHTNALGQNDRFTANVGTNVIYDEQYARDVAGRISQKTVSNGSQTATFSYTYDALGRLVDVTKNGTPSGHFEYDANGNRTLAYGINASYDNQDRMTQAGGAKYNYTPNGELQQIIAGTLTTNYTYDVLGNLTHAGLPGGGAIDYVVDGRNRRVGKKVNGVLTQGFIYQDQLKLVAELDAQSNVVSRFVYGGKINVPDYMIKGGSTYRIITDYLGSVRLVVNSTTGGVAQQIDYDEWGNVQNDTNPGFQPFGYAGGLYDSDTKLTRFGARDYDAQTGRWLSKDPTGFSGGDSSLYAYVRGNPVSFVDPRGTDPFIGATIGLIAGAVQGYIGAAAQNGSTSDEIAGALIGGIIGAGIGALDPSLGVGTLAIIGATSGVAGDAIGQGIAMHGDPCKKFNIGSTIGAGIGGALGGYAGAVAAPFGEGIGEWTATTFVNVLTSGPAVSFPIIGGDIWDRK